MPTLMITRGLPGCGKSTLAREWVAEDPVGRANVNRDDLRAMAHDGTYVKGDAENSGTEKSIIAVRDAAITALLKRGVSVFCSDTNLPQRVARDLRRIATLTGAEFTVVDMTYVPVDVCIERDSRREGRAQVGEKVIRDLHTRYIKGRTQPLPLPDEPEDPAGTVMPYIPRADKPSTVMVDIDGTVALMFNRSPFDETRVNEDLPNRNVIAAVRAMYGVGYQVVFCSGRTDACREATEKWLTEHVGVPYAALHMRAAGDMRKDSVVKLEIFDKHIRANYRVLCVFDDRNQVVEMWRSLGMTVLQVADGNF